METIQKVPIESILYGNYIKYHRLKDLVYTEFKNSDATRINLYIDLNSFLSNSYQFMNDNFNIVPSICLNYCAHFREFFNKMGVDTNIIMIYSIPRSSTNTRFIIEYWKNYSKRYVDLTSDNIEYTNEVLKILTPYLRDIYFKISTVESGVVIKHMIDNIFNNGCPNIVISSSEYMFQLPSMTNCVVFHKKRFKTPNGLVDISYSYNQSTAISWYINEIRNVTSILWIIPEMISTLMSMIGIPQRSISCILGVDRAFNILRHIDIDRWKESYGDVIQMYSLITDHLTESESKSLSFEEYSNRFRAIDINYQTILYRELPEYNDNTFMIRLNDPEKVKMVNNNIFANNPINLEWL